MRAAVVVAAALAGCYESPSTCGIACTDRCPGDLTCSGGVCVGRHGECAPPEYAFAAISVGARHACGIDARGALACWGDNTHRQVGADAIELEAFLPQQLAGTWSAVAAGAEHTCAIASDGALWCWGTDVGPHAIAAPADAPAFTQIAAGGRDTCAIGAGQLWCLGATGLVRVGAATDWTQISAGRDRVCGIAGGTVQCWPTGAPDMATAIPLPGASLAIDAGDRTSCAIVEPGTLWCWAASAAPVQIGDATDWTQIRAGGAALCGIRGGHAVCWGDDADIGALGDGVWSGTRDAAHAVDLGPADDVAVSSTSPSGELQAFGCLRRGNEVACWGDDASGQLGIGAAAVRREPVEVAAPTGKAWARVFGGREHVCATTDDRLLYCWGSDAEGAIRAADPRGETLPCTLDAPCDQARPLRAPAAIDRVTDVVTGDGYTCTREGDAIACWGNPANLGAPGGGVVSVPPPGAQWIGLVGGERATCGITAPGDPLACWGDVAGVATAMPTSVPATGLDAIGAGDGFACAHRSDGARVCWGRNGVSQLGDGTTIDRAQPTAFDVGGFLAVAARTDHACGIASDRSVACWGDNTAGVAGQPTGTTVSQPTSVAGLAGCTQLALGASHACAVCDGRTLCWGDNARGALGRGDTDRTGGATPAPVALAGTITDIALTRRGTCAIDSDHHLSCWGDGRHGELGNGGQARNVPTPLGARP